MSYESVRAQLDKLLGPDRNGPLNTKRTREHLDYRHPSICKHYILGFCPNDLYIKHRSEPGSCRQEHSDTAKAAFEKDQAAGRVRDERVRWMRALLNECRAVVADEDRKIRGHARRLQETYSAAGDLSGLMIRSFDTLKKLGMVSKNAKIKILSELDDEDFGIQVTEEGEETEGGNEEEKKQNASKRSADEQKSSDMHEGSSNDEENTHQRGNTADEDDSYDDDDDGFGLIKVISGAANTEGAKKGVDSANSLEGQATGLGNVLPDVHHEPSSMSDATKPATGENESKINSKLCGKVPGGSDTEKVTGTVRTTPERSLHNGSAAIENSKEGVLSQETAEVKPQNTARELDTDKEKGGEAQGDGGTTAVELPENVMEKFYEEGIGPDGLLMLDRKQSLRVCACCGGYISLVDAESRLLSHYGGKSHHSLAQLREKVVELDGALAAESKLPRDPDPRSFARSRVDNAEPSWPRRDDSRSRHRERPGHYNDRRGEWQGDGHSDRYGGRSYRGHGTTEWYRPPTGERDTRGSNRRYEERPRYDHRYNGRYESGRKRYRSPSPSRGNRRSRRYY